MQTFLHSQQRNATCAVAAIRTVLHWQFNVRVSESALVALGTHQPSTILAEGSDVHDMRRVVREASIRYNRGAPWTLRVRTRGTAAQLRYWTHRGRWPIVQVYLAEQSQHHAVVVVGVENDQVCYFDPDPTTGRSVQRLGEDAFLAWWLSPVDGSRWWSVINGGDLVVRL